MHPLAWFSGLTGLLALGLIVLIAVAFVDAAIRPASAYVAANKLTKSGWLLILGVAFACVFVFGFGLLGAAAIVAALVYFLDVRPKLREAQGGGGQGPYGPW